MHATDFEAVIYNGNIYCTECLPIGIYVDDDDVIPIFSCMEWSQPGVICDTCGYLHDYMMLLDSESHSVEMEDE